MRALLGLLDAAERESKTNLNGGSAMQNYMNAASGSCSYSASVPPVPERQREVDSAIDRLAERGAQVEDVLSVLIQRLGPVLRQPANTAGAKDSAYPNYSCTVAGRIGAQGDRLEIVLFAIRDILDRLEV
jgi:hypothetical protein